MHLEHQTKFFGSVVFAVLLTACGGGGGGGGSKPPPAAASSQPQSQSPIEETFVLGGRVTDGPLIGADIAIYDRNNELLANATSDGNALYQVELQSDAAYPLRISVTGGTDLVTAQAAEFELVSHVFDAEQNVTNVSSITTVVGQISACGGEITKPAFTSGWGGASQALLLGLNEEAVGDPLISNTNAAEIPGFLLANEAVAEWLRRTVATLGDTVSYAEAIEAIACDLADGSLDGKSPQPLSTQGLKTVMVARVLEPALRLEILFGELQVGGANATPAIDSALSSIQPDAEGDTVRDTPLAADARSTLVTLLGELELVLSSPDLGDLKTTIASANQVDDLRVQGLNPDWSSGLQAHALTIARADEPTIAALAEQFENPQTAGIVNDGQDEQVETAETSAQTPQNVATEASEQSTEDPQENASQVPSEAPILESQPESEDQPADQAHSQQQEQTQNPEVEQESQEETQEQTDNAAQEDNQQSAVGGGEEAPAVEASADTQGDSEAPVGADTPQAQGTEPNESGNDDQGAAEAADGTRQENQNQLIGTVGYGVVRGAKVVVYDRDRVRLSETISDASGEYQLTYPASAQFPLHVEASNGFDEATQAEQAFTLSAYVTDASLSTAHLSSFTTLAQNAALCIDDYSQQRWNQIWAWSKKPLTLGLKPDRLAEPMWSDVAATANSIYVLTDQAVRELVRRTSVALQGVVDTEGVLSTLACDLIDGRLNGVLPRDATPVQERILMVLKAVEAKLRLELIAQNFTVNMADAYAGIDGALLAAQPENALIPTRALKVRYTALDDAVLALERVAPVEPALNELVSELEKIGNGAWAQVGTAVNTQYQALIRDTIFAIARAEDEVIGRLFRGQNINDNAVASQSQPESAGGEQSSAATPPQEVSAPTSAGQQNQESSGTETADPNPSDANAVSGNGNETDSDPNVEPPTLAFVGGSDEIDIGGSVQLSWQSASADSCLADGGWSGVKAPNGSETVGPLSKSTTFRLSCEGAGGSAVVLFAVEVFKSYELSWIPPVENVDGSKVRGLSQFKIYYGTESRVYDNFIPVDGRQKSYRVSLPVGRYNFAVTAVDLEGDESQYSNEVVKD